MKAIVKEIQVGGLKIVPSLAKACEQYVLMMSCDLPYVAKIRFSIELPNGETKSITIRDEDEQTVAYGDFEGLPSFLDYAKEASEESK